MGKRSFAARLQQLFSAHDMTLGAPWKRILEFAIPMLIGNLAQQLYNTADSIIVGRYVGDNALAAVGSASPILNLLLALFVGVATGVGILVAQRYGAKDREQLSVVIGNCITLSAIVSVITMIIGALITRPMLELLSTPASIIDWCADYLMIYFLGIAGFAYYNILSGVLRGMGDSLSALVFLLVAAALNVGLDLWFVAGLGMGVAGVALATVLAQTISAFLCLWKLLRMRDVFDLTLHYLKPCSAPIANIIRIGVPSGITQAIFSVAMLVVQSLTNSFGEMVIACNVIVMRVDGFAMMPNFTFGQAMTTYTGQNVGACASGCKAGHLDRRRHLRFPDCIDSFIRPPTDGRFYRNSRAGRFEHAHDADSRLRIYRHVHYSVSLWRDAGRRRHNDANVDLHHHHCCAPRSHCLRHRILYTQRRVSHRAPGIHLYLPAGLLVAGRTAHGCRLSLRRLA